MQHSQKVGRDVDTRYRNFSPSAALTICWLPNRTPSPFFDPKPGSTKLACLVHVPNLLLVKFRVCLTVCLSQGLTGRVTESSMLSGMGNTVFLPQDLMGVVTESSTLTCMRNTIFLLQGLTSLVGQASWMRGLLTTV